MVVLYEFFSNSQIENVVTCLRFKVDKVVCLGYEAAIYKSKNSFDRFVKTFCGVSETEFIIVSEDNLDSVTETMREAVKREIDCGSKVYFDITGGESLALVAFGRLSEEFAAPVHSYDIEKDIFINQSKTISRSMKDEVEEQNVIMDIDMYFEMYGGKINYFLQKESREADDEDSIEDIVKIWNIAVRHWDLWNYLSDFVRKNLPADENLRVYENGSVLGQALKESKNPIGTVKNLRDLLEEFAREGLFSEHDFNDGIFRYKYKNERVKECLWDGGAVLELYTYLIEKRDSDDCRVGVHVDWDGIIHSGPGEDVLNEIDVVSLTGLIPTFISCKSGKMDNKMALYALYELNTIAERFGGKYVKKKLLTIKPIGDIELERANEMGIEVIDGRELTF